MTHKINFTQDRIRNLPTPKEGRIDYYDIEVPKLTCRVSNTGIKSFVLLKWTGKTMQRVTLGRFPDVTVNAARKMAQAALTELAQGINPTEQKRVEKIRRLTLAGC